MVKNVRIPVSLLLLTFLFGITACRTSREEQAAQSVDDFFKAVADDDFEKARELSTEKSKPVLVKVENEAKNYRPDVKPAPVEVVVIDKILEDTQAWVTVDIKVGPKVKREKIRLVWENDRWRVVVPKPQIQVVRYVVFYDQYERVVLPKIRLHPVIEVSLEEDDDHHHHGRGHAYDTANINTSTTRTTISNVGKAMPVFAFPAILFPMIHKPQSI